MKSSGLFSEYRTSFFVTVTVSASLLRPLTSMNRLEPHVHVALKSCVHRHQVVHAIHLNAVAA